MSKEMNTEKKPFNKRKLKYGAVATVIVIVFIAVVVVLNIIAGMLTERKNLKLDLTSEKFFEVSQESLDYVSGIDTEVEIAVMAKESDFLTSSTYMKMVLETLEKYDNASENVTLNFYDIVTNPDVATKFAEYYQGEVAQGDIVVVANERAEVLSVNSLFTMTSDYYGQTTIQNYKGEQELTSAIMTVTDANPQTVAFISKYNGAAIYHQYNSYSIATLYSLLDKNGYKIVELDIMTDELSAEEYDMVVLPAPLNDLTESCITKLDDFLYNDGNLDKDMIYIADPYQYATPNIDDFLEIWGIEVGAGTVYDYSEENNQVVTTALGQGMALIANIADETYSEGLPTTKLPIVAANVRPVELLFDSNSDRTTTSLLTTSETGFVQPMEMYTAEEAQALAESMMSEVEGEDAEEAEEAEEVTEAETEETTEFDPEAAEKKVQNLMAVATKTSFDAQNTAHVNNVMVIGGSMMLDQYIANSATYNNADYMVNAINKMCGKESSVIIAEKDLTKEPISVTAAQKSTISKVIYAIPILVVVAGIVVRVRRRNR